MAMMGVTSVIAIVLGSWTYMSESDSDDEVRVFNLYRNSIGFSEQNNLEATKSVRQGLGTYIYLEKTDELDDVKGTFGFSIGFQLPDVLTTGESIDLTPLPQDNIPRVSEFGKREFLFTQISHRPCFLSDRIGSFAKVTILSQTQTSVKFRLQIEAGMSNESTFTLDEVFICKQAKETGAVPDK